MIGAWCTFALGRAERALERAGVARWELCASELYAASVEAMDGQIHVVDRSIERALGIRILDGGIGFAGLTEPTDDDLGEGIRRAIAETKRSRPAAIDDFAGPSSRPRPAIPGLDDPRADGTARAPISDLALELEAKTLAANRKIARVRPSRVAEQRGAFAFRTARGLDVLELHARAAAAVGAVAEDDVDAQSSYASTSGPAAEALEISAIASEAATRAAGLLGAGAFGTRRVPVIFSAESVADLVDLVAGALEADRVERGASFFADAIGARALHPAFTLYDDPHDAALDGACTVDGEGLVTSKKALVDRGVIAAILDDRESAARAGRPPNAQAVRAGASVRPAPGVHGLVLAGGAEPMEAIYRRGEGGLYVQELSGTHTVNEVTGELSLGAKGWAVREGALGRPIEGVTVSGMLTDLLSREIVASRETRRLGAVSVPILLIGELQVSS
jgi:PmbA protein